MLRSVRFLLELVHTRGSRDQTVVYPKLERYINAGMEKEIPDSMTTVQIKPEYAPSESAFGSEPPPAYHRPKSTAVQVTKIIAVTVVLVTFVLGGFILASAYITANASCHHLEQELALLTETLDRYQSASGPLQPEALVQEEIKIKTDNSPPTTAESKSVKAVHKDDNNLSDDSSSSNEYDSDDSDDDSSEEQDRIPIHIKLPLQLDFDDLAGALIEKNQRSRMNCIVEKKRAEEVVDHQPKNINLPFGVNITTDPRYEHVSGERMAIFCESGNMQRNADPQQRDTEDTVMIQPIMIPIPPSNYATHMNMQQQGPPHPMPPMMNMMQQHQQPMHPMEQMRPPMPHPMMMMPPPQQQQSLQDQQQQQSQQQSHLPPSAVLHHIAQQIIMQQLEAKHRAAAAQAAAEDAQTNELGTNELKMSPLQRVQEMQRMSRIPIPAAILNELQRIPSNARGEVIVAVSQDPSSEESGEPQQMPPQQAQQQQQPPQMPMMPPQPADIVRVIQHARESAQGMNGRQTYARGLPVDIPVPMMQQEAEERAAAASEQQEESRPHYVHPRSVRSVDSVLLKSQKRAKRCACDCLC